MSNTNGSTVSAPTTPETSEQREAIARGREYLHSEAEGFAAESAKLRDLAYVRDLGHKAGSRLARRDFMKLVDKLRK
jgi:hypothetical protein